MLPTIRGYYLLLIIVCMHSAGVAYEFAVAGVCSMCCAHLFVVVCILCMCLSLFVVVVVCLVHVACRLEAPVFAVCVCRRLRACAHLESCASRHTPLQVLPAGRCLRVV